MCVLTASTSPITTLMYRVIVQSYDEVGQVVNYSNWEIPVAFNWPTPTWLQALFLNLFLNVLYRISKTFF